MPCREIKHIVLVCHKKDLRCVLSKARRIGQLQRLTKNTSQSNLNTWRVAQQVRFRHHLMLRLCCSATTYFRGPFHSSCLMAGIPWKNGWQPAPQFHVLIHAGGGFHDMTAGDGGERVTHV
eukprot:3012856-Amphidinium_carterae.1